VSQAADPPAPSAPLEDPRLTPWRKVVYANGDFTVNTVLVSLNIVFVTYFLTQIAGLRPELAGLVQLVARTVDAFTDPAMGRISDRCRWRWGRRRPFFVLGALPFGLCYALLWVDASQLSQAGMFAYYTSLYVGLSLAMTVLSIPYLALQPEMALGYDARTSLNTYRNLGSTVGIFAGTVTFRPLAEALGGGSAGFALTGVVYGVLMAAPWFAVYAVTWERPEFQSREARLGFVAGARLLVRHRTFRQLTGLYLCGRISMDLIGAILILYFTHVIGRSDDFELTMALFIATIVVTLPVWLRVARHTEKVTLFRVGSIWWAVSLALILFAQPDWPRWVLFAFAPIGGIGFAVTDLMPWSMLGEVVDEDDLRSGERREGVYNGFFMFVRKLGGTIAVALAMALLGALGFTKASHQSASVQWAIRLLASVAPAAFLLLSVWISRGYPLGRDAHNRILHALEARGGLREPGLGPEPAAGG
jgi:sugar (glycoside-pentoside-hexuronide) transporter